MKSNPYPTGTSPGVTCQRVGNTVSITGTVGNDVIDAGTGNDLVYGEFRQ